MPLPFASAVDDDLAAIAVRLRRSTVEVRAGRGRATGHGSGIVWDARGLVVTNAHVARAPRATITLADGRSADARLVAHDPRRDLATLQIDAPPGDLAPATVGDARALRPGHVVVAHGHPLGHAHSLAVGVVHAVDGTPFGRRAGAVIAADIRLAPGNSGGPLANAAGEVVGVNSMIAGGLGIAIPATTVARFLRDQRPRPRLGVSLRGVTVALRAARPGEPRAIAVGLLVLEVAGGSAAARAGVLPGDVLLGVDGTPFASADDLLDRLAEVGAGSTLRLDVGRAGRRTVADVTLGASDWGGRTRRAA